MKSIQFPEVNTTIGADQPEYNPLFSFVDKADPQCPAVMCFEFTDDEIKKIVETKRIWYTQLMFRDKKGHPNMFQPMSIQVDSPIVRMKHKQAFCKCYYRPKLNNNNSGGKAGLWVYNTCDGPVPLEIKFEDGEFEYVPGRDTDPKPNYRITNGDYFFRPPYPQEVQVRYELILPLAEKDLPLLEGREKALSELKQTCAEHPVLCRVHTLDNDIDTWL
jgi:hypothetical protein